MPNLEERGHLDELFFQKADMMIIFDKKFIYFKIGTILIDFI